MSDWGAYFIAGLIGASLGWAVCSVWAVRVIDAERRRSRQTRQSLNDYMQGIDPVGTPFYDEMNKQLRDNNDAG